MTQELIKHQNNDIMLKTLEEYKDTITPKQYEVLKNNVFTIDFDKDEIGDKYRGCGSGWAEIDADGQFVDIKYFNDEAMKDINFVSIVTLMRDNYADDEQNIDTIDEFDELTYSLLMLPNGNIRFVVNFSCTQLVRF